MLDGEAIPASPAAHTAHPLDPLTSAEIEQAAAILHAATGDRPTLRFVSITLRERPHHDAGSARAAFCVLYDRAERTAYEAVVSLAAHALESLDAIPGVQPPIMEEEIRRAEELVRDDPRWQAAMRRRGVTDLSLAVIDPWPPGYAGPEDDAALRRICRPLTFIRSTPGDNGYARPVEGVIAKVDLDEMTVLDVIDHGVVPLPPDPGNYTPRLMAEPGNHPCFARQRTDARPIEITQPEGPSFTVTGHQVAWQKWLLRVGFTPREGLVLYDVGYEDGGRIRPLFHRMSLSEMFVPYGDPNPTHVNKNVFDEGEVGMGLMANSLVLGCDCLGEIRYFDAVVSDQAGRAVPLPHAICLHEEDSGVAWKHTDHRTGLAEVRRGRRLVISFFATVGNYDYGFFWYFSTDGSIEYEVKLNGILSVGATEPGLDARFGTLIAPGLYAPNHQHFFNVRMDACIDGPNNSVHEVDSAACPLNEDNPRGNAWRAAPRLLETTLAARRRVDPAAARTWKIINPGAAGSLGRPTGYELVPGHNVLPFLHEDSTAARRAGFAFQHLWVTRYDPKEMYAAGDYPYQSSGGDGLPAYAAKDLPIVDTDIVIWYTFGQHHVPRPEDWPVMPSTRIGFTLRPSGFFDGNPALDIASPETACHDHANAGSPGHRP